VLEFAGFVFYTSELGNLHPKAGALLQVSGSFNRNHIALIFSELGKITQRKYQAKILGKILVLSQDIWDGLMKGSITRDRYKRKNEGAGKRSNHQEDKLNEADCQKL
jgi:hypothetical protein